MTEQEELTLDRPALEVFAACIEANVVASQHATDRVIEFEREKARQHALDFVRLYKAVDAACEAVTSRALERALNSMEVALDDAMRTIAKESA